MLSATKMWLAVCLLFFWPDVNYQLNLGCSTSIATASVWYSQRSFSINNEQSIADFSNRFALTILSIAGFPTPSIIGAAQYTGIKGACQDGEGTALNNKIRLCRRALGHRFKTEVFAPGN